MPAKKASSKKPFSRKPLPAWLTEVTPLSKALAMTIFIVLPFFTFWLGAKLQAKIVKEWLGTSQAVIRKGCSSPQQWLENGQTGDTAERQRLGQSPTPVPTPRPR